MKKGRQSYAEQTRARLLDLWRGEEAFGRPIGCVTTTFTFDPELFEEQCLARFLAIESNPNETAKAYLIEREEKLSQCFACVLVDRVHVAPDRSLRWNLLPVRLPRGGILHAKLTILAWEHCVRVLIGSANLTEPGYRRNQEVMAVLDFGSAGEIPADLLRQCVSFLHQVRQFAPGSERRDAGPQKSLATFLHSLELQANALPPVGRTEAECVLLSLLPGGKSVLDQIKAHWKGAAPNEAWVLSPFFDKDGAAQTTAARFAEILTTRGGRSITFMAPGRRLPDGAMQIYAPDSLKMSSHPSLEHQFSMVKHQMVIEGKTEERLLHAKAVWLARDSQVLYMLGSSNFTAAGLGLYPAHNIELNVAYLIRDDRSQFAKLCDESWPASESLKDLDVVLFLSDESADSSENPDAPILPAAFGSALYCVDKGGAHLELEIGSDAPANFVVYSRNGETLLEARIWLHGGKQSMVNVLWAHSRPPSALDVRWHDQARGECTGQWIVNVADMSALPPLDELGSLTLAELMEILTSARPMHEVVGRLLERREKGVGQRHQNEIDPLKRVDTSQFLLMRMRRVSRALEGMRERLQQPVGTVDAMRWRLRGPIGPIALARRLAEEDPQGAAFMICEVAATLRSASWRPIGSLGLAEIDGEVAETVDLLRALAVNQPAPSNLSRYVNATFKELCA